MKKVISLLITMALLSSSLLCGCSKSNKNEDPTENIEQVASTDKYRNYYQIFVNSFCDSDGDTFGDLQGIISKLDYLNDGNTKTDTDLGIDGIWLTPVMESRSYHKYDVDNYYNIDERFGNLETFDKLVEECHKRGINLIIDLVLNHISSENPLYLQALDEISEGKMDGAAEYFEIHEPSFFADDVQVNPVGNGLVCEANFSHYMPEWNLNSEKTREEFKKIAKFWLDRGVDGFRLDAVKYFNNPATDGEEFLKWFVDTCKEINPDVYIVGENWDDDSEILNMYKSGIDSQFCFKFAQTNGLVTSEVIAQRGSVLAKKVMNYNNKMQEVNENYINAMFLSNHDMVRSANAFQIKGLSYQKMAASVYMLFPGNPFIYYGEEIGITAPKITNDTYYRTPMIFDSEANIDINVNGMQDVLSVPKDGGVVQQLANKNSLLNHYKKIIKIKNQNPEIARGNIVDVEEFEDSSICAYYVEYNNSKLMIIHNMSAENTKEITIKDDMIQNPVIRGYLVASEVKADENKIENAEPKVTLVKNILAMPPQSTVVIKTE